MNQELEEKEIKETIGEAEIKEELTIEKPEFTEKLDAKVVGVSKIENNVEKAKEYAINLKKYYSTVEFTEDTKKDAEDERAQINKQKKLVADFRKKIVAEYNKPIEKFESIAKETEKILGETADFITSKVSVYDQLELKKVEEKVQSYFDEYKQSKDIDFVSFDKLGMNITKGLLTGTSNLTKKTQDTITDFIDGIRKDLDLIETLDFKDEILVEYKKSLKCADSIAMVHDRHKQLEEMQKQKEEQKEKQITDESMLNRIDEVLSAPSIKNKEQEMIETAFVIRVNDIECLKEIKEVCAKYDAQIISLVKEEGVYHD